MKDLSAQTRGGCAECVPVGTGSIPPALHGLHRNSRIVASAPPLSAPWTSIASAAYSEQVGWNRQAGGMNGDTKRL